MSDVHAASARLRQVANGDDGYGGLEYADPADLRTVLTALHEATVLLGEYAHRERDIVQPEPHSLIGQTRALLARLGHEETQ